MNNNNKKEGVLKKVALAPVKLLNWTAKPVYMPVVNQVKESKERLKPLVEFYDPRNIKKIKENARVETYEKAKIRLNVNESDIDTNHMIFCVVFNIMLVFLTGLIIAGLVYMYQGHIIQSLECFSISSLCFSCAFTFSFRAYQIRIRKLCSVKEYMESPSNWIPPFRR